MSNNLLYDSFDHHSKAFRYSESPSGWNWEFDYDGRTDLQPVYQGWYKPGTGEGESKWIIYKFTYNADGSVSKRQVATDVDWTNRATHF
jgi:hypothetical protein